jgi:hypothetical protein
MKHIHSAIEHAAKQTSRYMTGQLRREAKASGWPRQVSANMGVIYDNKKFQVHVHDNHLSEANDLEYGTTSSRPTAAIRRSTNRTQDADAFFMKTLRKVVGEL